MHTLSVLYSELPVSVSLWKQQALAWASEHHEAVAYYEPNEISYRHGAFQNILGIRRKISIAPSPFQATTFAELRKMQAQTSEAPLLGILTYDLKNQIEELQSHHPDHIGFPELFFFRPEIWLEWHQDSLTIYSDEEEPATVIEAISSTPFLASFSKNRVKTEPRISRDEYIKTVEKLQNHILEGDVYEVNFCQEFYAEKAQITPQDLFWKLNAASPTPFAGFLQLKDCYLLCASPERFLKKEDQLLISQPIKGTIRRGNDPVTDEYQKHLLASSEKERAENMMIVDLVRNDLNRVTETGTVQVEEFCGLYEFQYVWQMISTITGKLRAGVDALHVIQAPFPMGSMTGAPKIKALELIEQYEKTKRGLYSGSFGYFLPNGDFDFNVVIRSLQYNATSGYLSFEVGSAITYDSNPLQEYEECLLKAEAIRRVLDQ